MNLLLSLCLAWALLQTAETLRCLTCSNEMCTNTNSVECPATSTACRTVTSVTHSNSSTSVTVNKTCSTLLSCVTPVNIATEWSVNRGYKREAHNQICCISDNCNLQTLATPTSLTNGKVCPTCASSANSMAGSCNATLSCVGAEDSCFTANTTLTCGSELQLGCTTRNICNNPTVLAVLFGSNLKVTCAAPWSIRMSTVILACALTAFKILV